MNFFTRFNRFGKTASDDRRAYHSYQIQIGEYYLQHFVRPYAKGKKILDIGCGEGGVLTPFEKAGYNCTGLEYSTDRVKYAREKDSSNIKFIEGNVEEFSSDDQYDVILMLDVIEHVNRKLLALENIKRLLLAEGIVVISFPPFRSPFGGHQQMMKSFLKYIPYIHLLPEVIYKQVLKKIEQGNVESRLRDYKTGITMREFEKLINQTGFKRIQKITYLIRPRQAFRFGLKIKPYRIKFLREYLTTGVDYILG